MKLMEKLIKLKTGKHGESQWSLKLVLDEDQ